MGASRPLEVHLTFVLCPQYLDLETDDFDPSPVLDAFDDLMAQINGMSLSTGDICHLPYSGNIQLKVEPINQDDMQTMVALSDWALLEGDSIALRVCAKFDDPNRIAKHHRSRGQTVSKDNLKQLCANITEILIKKLLVLMNFYLPGSSDCKYVYPTNEDSEFPNLVCRSHFQNTALALSSAGMRLTPEISFSNFFEWSNQLSGFWTGETTQPLSRCLNFVSYVHHHTHQLNTLADFSWIMAALEAILTENSQEIRSKMVRRTILLVPEIEKFLSTKQIGRIYDFRSRFIHGDLKIRNHFYDDFEFDWPGKEFADNFTQASAILFKCVHAVAERGWTKLAFEDTVAGS